MSGQKVRAGQRQREEQTRFDITELSFLTDQTPPAESGKLTRVQRLNKLIIEIEKKKKRVVELRQGRVGAIEKLSKFKKPSANHKTKPKEEYTHWDYLLMEMQWMATHFHSDFKAKNKMASKLARHCIKGSKSLQSVRDKKEKKAISELKKKAQFAARSVLGFWRAMQKIVEHNHSTLYRWEKDNKKQERMFEFVDEQMKLSTSLAQDLQVIHQDSSGKRASIASGLIPLGIGNPTTRRNPAYPGFDEEVTLTLMKQRMKRNQIKYKLASGPRFHLEVPFLLKHELREYQITGLKWLRTLHDKGLNGILADEMGLGKTIQTIGLLASLACEKGIWGPHLIIVPTSIILNWEYELKKWCPALKVLTYFGTQRERKQKRVGWTRLDYFHVYITSYKLIIQDHHIFRRKRWYFMILDEAQHIKNFRSQRWKILLKFYTKRRLLITGTPLQNDVMELWSLMHFLMPHIFQSHLQFKDWFSSSFNHSLAHNTDVNEALIRNLQTILRPFLLRRLKSEVERQMPSKVEHVVMCGLSRRQRYLYDQYINNEKTQAYLRNTDYFSVMNVLMQLRKVCNHPDLFQPRDVESPLAMESIELSCHPLLIDIPASRFSALTSNAHSALFLKHQLILPLLDFTYTQLQSNEIQGLSPGRRLDQVIEAIQNGYETPLTCNNKYEPVYRNATILQKQNFDHRIVKAKFPKQFARNEDALFRFSIPRHISASQLVPFKRFIFDTYLKRSQFESSDLTCANINNLANNAFTSSLKSRLRQNILEKRDSKVKIWKTIDFYNQFYLIHRIQPVYGLDCLKFCKKLIYLDPMEMTSHHKPFSCIGKYPSDTLTPSRSLNRFVPMLRKVLSKGRYSKFIEESERGFRFSNNLIRLLKSVSDRYLQIQREAGVFHFYTPPVLASQAKIHFVKTKALVEQSVERIELMNRKCLQSVGILNARRMWKNHIIFPQKKLIQYDAGKLYHLASLLKKIKAKEQKAIVFTQMSKMLDILEKFMNLHNFTYVRLDGSVKVSQRQAIVDEFNGNPKVLCFISSTRCGGIGINLTAANSVIFYDTDWNPAMDLQAQDRCHRIGQTRTVHIYRLISEKTVEENIYKKSVFKRDLEAKITKGGFNPENFILSLSNVVQEEELVQRKSSSRRVVGKEGDEDEERKGRKQKKSWESDKLEELMEQVEDKDDYDAFQQAQEEIKQENEQFNNFEEVEAPSEEEKIVEEFQEEKEEEEKQQEEEKEEEREKVKQKEDLIQKGEIFDWKTYPGLNSISKYALRFVEQAYTYETYSAIREMDEEQKRAKEEKIHQVNTAHKNECFARDDEDMTGILYAKSELSRQSAIKEYMEGMAGLQQYYQVAKYP